MRRIPILALVLLSSPSAAQDWQRDINALRPTDLSAQESTVLDNLELRAKVALAAIERAKTADEADRARPAPRERLRRSLGLDRLPWPPSLQPKSVGLLEREGYQIEKIVYETLPGMQVPALLYLPKQRRDPAPGIVFYPGHWWADSKARPDFQAFCINMARLGFVVLTFDPFGQGERGISSRDHRRTETLLVGVSQQGIAAYETQCALEYLLSRHEVDKARIGLTGASGGGYNTWITTALDDRIAAAVPVVGTSEFLEQIHVCRPLDWYHAAEHCHFVPGLIRYANNQELLAMAAPRPVLIIAADRDQSFPLAGVREIYGYGSVLYESYRAREKVGLFEDLVEGHGYQRRKREAAYGWFVRWLMRRGDGGAIDEPPTETMPIDAPELRCFHGGQSQPAGPAIIAMVERLASTQQSRPSPAELDRILGLPPTRHAEALKIERRPLQRLLIATEPKLNVPAFLLLPQGDLKGLIVAVDDRGKEAVVSEPWFPEALSRGWAICGVDPRGVGELATSKSGWVFAVSLLLGENFVGRQAWDLTQTLQALSGSEILRGKPIGLCARGHNTSLALTYALARESTTVGSSPRWFMLRDGFLSLRAFFERPESLALSYRLQAEDRDRMTAFDREIPATYFAFDALRSFDLRQLLESSQAQGIIVNPIDGDWHTLDPAKARALVPRQARLISDSDPDLQIKQFLHSVDRDQ